MSDPKHRRHKWSAIREIRVEAKEPRHADTIITRLGAHFFDVDDFAQLLEEVGPGNPFKAGAGR